MRELLNSILQFRDAVDTLYNYSLLEAARLDSFRDHERVSTSFEHLLSLKFPAYNDEPVV